MKIYKILKPTIITISFIATFTVAAHVKSITANTIKSQITNLTIKQHLLFKPTYNPKYRLSLIKDIYATYDARMRRVVFKEYLEELGDLGQH